MISDYQRAARKAKDDAFRAERIDKIIDLITESPKSWDDLAAHFGVHRDNLRRYVNPLVAQGHIIKWKDPISTHIGRPTVYFTINEEQAELLADKAIRLVRKTWTPNTIPMFAPMAYLFGRAPC